MPFFSPALAAKSRALSLFKGRAYNRRSYKTRPKTFVSSDGYRSSTDYDRVNAELSAKVSAVNAFLASLEVRHKQYILDRAKAICPVLTGKLRNSLEVIERGEVYRAYGSILTQGSNLGPVFIAIIAVDYDLYSFIVDSPLPYWDIENQKNSINDIAVEAGIRYAQPKLPELVQIGTGSFTTIYIRS